MKTLRLRFALAVALLAAVGWPARGATPAASVVSTALPFRTASGLVLKLDVYQPPWGPGGPLRAAVLAIHGGGWMSGDRGGLAAEARMLCRHGFVVVLPDYRLSGTAKFPAALKDVAAAFEWVVRHAGELHVDPSRIGTFGASAGGQLALLLGMTRGEEDLRVAAGLRDGMPAVAACCSWFGPTDLLADADGVRVSENTRQLVLGYMGGPAAGREGLYRLASAVQHVSRHVGPVLLVHGEDDSVVPVGQSAALYERLKGVGADVTFVRVRGGGHWFVGNALTPTVADVGRATVDFFSRALSSR